MKSEGAFSMEQIRILTISKVCERAIDITYRRSFWAILDSHGYDYTTPYNTYSRIDFITLIVQ